MYYYQFCICKQKIEIDSKDFNIKDKGKHRNRDRDMQCHTQRVRLLPTYKLFLSSSRVVYLSQETRGDRLIKQKIGDEC
jgi:hypothetical protein